LRKQGEKTEKNTTPLVSNNEQTIFCPDTETISFFKTEKVSNSNLRAAFTATAKIAATILASGEGGKSK